MKVPLITVLASLGLAGCGSGWDGSYELRISSRFDDRAREEVVSAAADWASRTGHARFKPVVDDGPCEDAGCINVAPDVGLIERRYHGGETLRGDAMASIIVDAGIVAAEDPIDLRVVLRHELGHALGLRDTNDPTTIMFGTMQRSTVQVTCADVARYAELRNVQLRCADDVNFSGDPR